jgi:hypothetical protein
MAADPITQGQKPAEQNILYCFLILRFFPNNVPAESDFQSGTVYLSVAR